MTPERAAERAAYIKAFIAANGGEPDHDIDFENGWWCFRLGYSRPQRYRSRDLREMTVRLLARGAEQGR